MKKTILFTYVFCYLFSFVSAQTLDNRKVVSFPASLTENSGIISTDAGKAVWTHNDSGGRAELYKMDTMGNIIRTFYIRNVTNIDWEDITQDNLGNIYIGDFGNNNNDRTNLVIYKVSNPDSSLTDTLDPKEIRFTYLNQTAFPPQSAEKNFDVESMIIIKDSIFLFTKNQTSPFKGWVRMYGMPTVPNSYELAPLDSFQTGTGLMSSYWISSAAISPDLSTFVMISSNFLWKFTNFPSKRVFQGSVTQYALNNFTQKEGVCFIDDTHLFISDESNATLGTTATLYMVDLVNGVNVGINETENPVFGTISPNPATNEIYFSNVLEKRGNIQIYENTGKCIFSANEIPNQISLENWANGLYFVQITDTNGKIYHSKFCISRP